MSTTTPDRCLQAFCQQVSHTFVGCWDGTHRSGWTWRFCSIRATWSCSPPGVWSSGFSSRTRSGPWVGLHLSGETGGPHRRPYLWTPRRRGHSSNRLHAKFLQTDWAEVHFTHVSRVKPLTLFSFLLFACIHLIRKHKHECQAGNQGPHTTHFSSFTHYKRVETVTTKHVWPWMTLWSRLPQDIVQITAEQPT